MTHLPKNQYYIQLDFRAVLFDGTLNSIDDAAQNIWTVMFYTSLSYEEIGHFKVNGKPLQIHDIARKLGKDLKKLKRVIPILLEVGLCEQQEDGTIIIPSSKFDQFACNLHTKCAQNDGITPAKGRQNAVKNGGEQPETTSPIKENNINREESPLTPQKGGEVVSIHTHNQFLNSSLSLLMDHTELSERECREHLGQWVQQAGNAQTVIDLVKAGVAKGDPISYISRCVENYAQKVASSPPEQENPPSSLDLLREQHAEDKDFQRLSRNDQGIVLNFKSKEKNDPWYIKFIENHNPSAFKYLRKNGLIPQREVA